MEKKVSVVIPNYNGKELLRKNLPSVIKNCPNCQIIIIDDASIDGSIEFVQKNFKEIKIIKLEKNRGFAYAVNRGVKEASGDLVLLLNSDVSPRKNFLKSALEHFNNVQVFAVGLADLSHEDGKIVTRGRGGASFNKGFVSHFKLPSISGETLWVSAGSGIFDKKKLLDLGGFDEIFAPFYWEDIDLSFRAWQIGYRCIFERKSEVDHFHKEGAIRKSKSKFLIKTVSYKNQFLFVWKNISDPLYLTGHILWLPYHLAKAAATFDFGFFVGFAWALWQIPFLIFNYSPFTIHNSLLDKEVFKKFEK